MHTYRVNEEDSDFLYKYLKDAISAQTLAIEHILRLKYPQNKTKIYNFIDWLRYGWFLEKQSDYVSDLAFVYRLYCAPEEFLHIMETTYRTAEEYTLHQ